MFIADAWYVAAWADEIEAAPIARRLLDQPVVIYRDQVGKVAALYDSCCHRGAPLSVGRVVSQGLQCGYHGLVFDGSGTCVHIPGQAMIPRTAKVRSYPVVERQQLVWIWMGDPKKADEALIVDVAFHDDQRKWPHRHSVYHIAAPAMMLADNLMDLTHLPFVHGDNVGGDAGPHIDAQTDVTPTDLGARVLRWFPDCPPPPTYRKAVPTLPESVERWQEFEFVVPGVMKQWTGAVPVGQGARDPARREGGFSLRMFHGLTPETNNTCHYFWSAANGYRQDEIEVTEQLFDELAKALMQDKVIVELQQSRISETGDAWLVPTRHDIARMAMRRAMDRMVASSGPVLAGPVAQRSARKAVS